MLSYQQLGAQVLQASTLGGACCMYSKQQAQIQIRLHPHAERYCRKGVDHCGVSLDINYISKTNIKRTRGMAKMVLTALSKISQFAKFHPCRAAAFILDTRKKSRNKPPIFPPIKPTLLLHSLLHFSFSIVSY